MTESNIEQARLNMIEQQIRPWEVLDRRVLDTMVSVPREQFVPEAYRGLAFADIEIPIGHGQTMMAPKVEARMLQALAIQPGDDVLEIGTGTGFISACLCKLGAHLTSVDIKEDFIVQARERLANLGFRKVTLHAQDGLASTGYSTPFEAIAVTGSLPRHEDIRAIANHLAVGGRLFVVTGEAPAMDCWGKIIRSDR
jgi:protein-L-isoaspartate(D-aspartate) O-methyltransferase